MYRQADKQADRHTGGQTALQANYRQPNRQVASHRQAGSNTCRQEVIEAAIQVGMQAGNETYI